VLHIAFTYRAVTRLRVSWADKTVGRFFCMTVAANLDDYPNRQQTAVVETTTVDVPEP